MFRIPAAKARCTSSDGVAAAVLCASFTKGTPAWACCKQHAKIRVKGCDVNTRFLSFFLTQLIELQAGIPHPSALVGKVKAKATHMP